MSAEEQGLRTYEVSIRTHTSSIEVEAYDEAHALLEAQEVLEQLHERDRVSDNLEVKVKP